MYHRYHIGRSRLDLNRPHRDLAAAAAIVAAVVIQVSTNGRGAIIEVRFLMLTILIFQSSVPKPSHRHRHMYRHHRRPRPGLRQGHLWMGQNYPPRTVIAGISVGVSAYIRIGIVSVRARVAATRCAVAHATETVTIEIDAVVVDITHTVAIQVRTDHEV